MRQLTHGSLFAGIGGFDLGFERAGIKTVWQVEIDPFCRAVLERHFPDARRYQNIKRVKRLQPVDIVGGGFPCQPVSLAGKRRGSADKRWLWPEFYRIVRLLRPNYVIVENVPGLLSSGMGVVLGDLASIGYDAEWQIISAADAGAPHLRERVWIVAYPMCLGYRESPSADASARHKERNSSAHRKVGRAVADTLESSRETVAYAESDLRRASGNERPKTLDRSSKDASNSNGEGLQKRNEQRSPATQRSPVLSRSEFVRASAARGRQQWEIEPDVGRVADGVSARVDRLKSLGNSIVPQIAEWIGKRIVASLSDVTPEGTRK
jgi:DNA (cytosine-5)-methyltransferase 1